MISKAKKKLAKKKSIKKNPQSKDVVSFLLKSLIGEYVTITPSRKYPRLYGGKYEALRLDKESGYYYVKEKGIMFQPEDVDQIVIREDTLPEIQLKVE